MTPTLQGTLDYDVAGGFVQGQAGDKNRIVADAMIMILQRESTSSTGEEAYDTPFDVARGIGFYNEDLATLRATVESQPERTIRMAVGWMFNTTLQFTVHIIPRGFAFPDEFAVERIGFHPQVFQTDPAPYRALFDLQAGEFDGPFTLFLRAQGFLINLLRPALARFIAELPEGVNVELPAQDFTSNRWIREANGFV